MTLPQFVEATGLYTQEEVESDEFRGLLRQVVKQKEDFCVLKEYLERFWATIANTPFSNNMVASNIRDLLYRFVHKILAATLIGRHEGDNKVNRHSLFCLMSMVERRPANLASILAWSFVRPKKGGVKARLCLLIILLRGCTLAGIITFDEPPAWSAVLPEILLPPLRSEADIARQATIPNRYQVHRTRRELPVQVYRIREPRPDPLTLESLYDGVEQVRQEMSAVRQEVQHVRQEMRDGIRVLLDHLQLPPPSSWQPLEEEPANEEHGSDE
ncbi:hypothetical protein Hanom_Chr09g00784141 [Helianthus anomalus]